MIVTSPPLYRVANQSRREGTRSGVDEISKDRSRARSTSPISEAPAGVRSGMSRFSERMESGKNPSSIRSPYGRDGKPRHFQGIAFCETKRAFFCLGCAAEHPADSRRFWAWTYSYRLKCPWREEHHASLDRLEQDRRHPWQRRPAWAGARRGMTPS